MNRVGALPTTGEVIQARFECAAGTLYAPMIAGDLNTVATDALRSREWFSADTALDAVGDEGSIRATTSESDEEAQRLHPQPSRATVWTSVRLAVAMSRLC